MIPRKVGETGMEERKEQGQRERRGVCAKPESIYYFCLEIQE
jgi:hypothetical protein